MANLILDLGDGLQLKQATKRDIDRLAEYNSHTLSDDPDNPEEFIEHWTRDLMANHPTAGPGDFTYVEDTHTGEIVSSLCLISQTWTYEEIPFGVGRVEMVSTNREYRRKGLIRSQFDVLHQWSREKGELMCAITGIPYFYRQFDYEMTLDLGGNRRGYRPHVPKLAEDETEPYTIRPATVSDIPFINRIYDHGRKRSLFSCPRNEAVWRYEMEDQHKTFRSDMTIIETPAGDTVGFLWHENRVHNASLGAFCYELKPGISWASVTPTVIRYLKSKGEEYTSQDEEKTWESFSFNLGTLHPVYDVAGRNLPEKNDPYAWYIRIPDLVSFLQLVSPVLNRRLSESDHAGYDGELLLDFHRSGIRLQLEGGAITQVEDWQPSTDDRGDLAFPGLAFLHLVCGTHSFSELSDFYPDCYSRKKLEALALIDILFPKKPSYVLGIV